MLWALNASSPKFKALTFRPGLNIIIADRDTQSSEAETYESRLQSGNGLRSRNGAGKSSIVDLIHFLLGGQSQGALMSSALADWTFELTLDIGGERQTVSRSLSNQRKRKVTTLGDTGLFVSDLFDGHSMRERSTLPNATWSRHLGQVWFRLDPSRAVGGASYRQMFSYFARRKRDGGFDDPVRTVRVQSVAAIETNLAYLFGLDAELVRRLHQTKAALKQNQSAQRVLSDLEKVTPAGARRVDLEAQLAAQIAASELTRNRLRERVETFNVLPAFRELERELAELNQEARDLSDDDVLDEEAINVNRRSLEAEQMPETPNLTRLFYDAQVIFPEVVTRRYEEVLRFHERVIANRQAHLDAELAASRRRIEERRLRREQLESRRREITASLRTSGPADELLRLRDELAARESDLRALQVRLEEARSLEQKVEQLQAELDLAVRALRQDRRERSAIVDEASRTFSEISERLYERPGQLAISATENGLSFLPTTPADQSAGVMSMQVFCFDLTLATLCNRRGIGPGFLVHDSHLFEPVDGRQFAKALRIAAVFAAESGVQYIATLNSDELVRAELEGEEDFSEFVLDTKLSDAPEGGLFGVQFD